MRIKCYSVRLESIVSISDKCFIVSSYDGRQSLIPKSQYYGEDPEVKKDNAHFISAWILEKVDIQYSGKKERWFDSATKKMLPTYKVEKHVPKRVKKTNTLPDESLIR